MHKVSKDSCLGVQCRSCICSIADVQLQDSTLPSCGLIAKAVGQGTKWAHEEGAADVEGLFAFIGTGGWAALTHELVASHDLRNGGSPMQPSQDWQTMTISRPCGLAAVWRQDRQHGRELLLAQLL